VRALEEGRTDLVLVAGVEKMTDLRAPRRRYWLGVSGDTEWERLAGLTFAGVYGLIASDYVHRYPSARDALAEVAVKNHENGSRNPNAHFQKRILREDVLRATRVADPLGLFDCCPVSDGAAALLLARADRAREFTDTPVYIDGLGAGSDRLAVQERPDLTRFTATQRAAEEAFRDAELARDRIHLLEVHDCFTIAELIEYEAMGLTPEGQGARAILEGWTEKDGRLPVNPSGGLKSKGHPVGATGVSMHVMASKQVIGQAGEMQIPNAALAGIMNMGGAAVANFVSILEPLRR